MRDGAENEIGEAGKRAVATILSRLTGIKKLSLDLGNAPALLDIAHSKLDLSVRAPPPYPILPALRLHAWCWGNELPIRT